MRRRWWLQLTQAVTDRDVRHAESVEKLRAQLASARQEAEEAEAAHRKELGRLRKKSVLAVDSREDTLELSGESIGRSKSPIDDWGVEDGGEAEELKARRRARRNAGTPNPPQEGATKPDRAAEQAAADLLACALTCSNACLLKLALTCFMA